MGDHHLRSCVWCKWFGLEEVWDDFLLWGDTGDAIDLAARNRVGEIKPHAVVALITDRIMEQAFPDINPAYVGRSVSLRPWADGYRYVVGKVARRSHVIGSWESPYRNVSAFLYEDRNTGTGSRRQAAIVFRTQVFEELLAREYTEVDGNVELVAGHWDLGMMEMVAWSRDGRWPKVELQERRAMVVSDHTATLIWEDEDFRSGKIGRYTPLSYAVGLMLHSSLQKAYITSVSMAMVGERGAEEESRRWKEARDNVMDWVNAVWRQGEWTRFHTMDCWLAGGGLRTLDDLIRAIWNEVSLMALARGKD